MASDPGDDDEREAEVLVCIPEAAVSIITRRRRSLAEVGDVLVLRVPASLEDLTTLAGTFDLPEWWGAAPPSEVCFAVCGDQRVPLCSAVPVLCLCERHYIFAVPGQFLEFALPSGAAAEEVAAFEGLLSAAGAPLRVWRRRQGAAGALREAGAALSHGLGLVAPQVDGGVHALLTAARDRIPPRDEPMQVSPRVMHTLREIRKVSGGINRTTGNAAGALDSLAEGLGEEVAAAASQRLSPSSRGRLRAATDSPRSPTTDLVSTGAGVAGQLLRQADSVLPQLAAIGAAAVSDMARHRFGEQAAEAVDEGLGVVGDMAGAAMHVQGAGAKTLARTAASSAAKSVARQVVTSPASRALQQEAKRYVMRKAASTIGSALQKGSQPPSPRRAH
eukprot:TRINITY_DN32129_c1_g1_i2.p2 TRINITY_DN32129_c1_g1~~TRINITY_DN32129_c1_g1_i2.p2  ORF type:complete len:390 (+),score=120.53 TRINITY_DN32129_c1_g1_i2:86-1255(+)